tara:strand:+ start:70 stop:504 length:435 start_codon:yes stop_codon:yes gene_type:complete
MEKIGEVSARLIGSGSQEIKEQPSVQQPERVIDRFWLRMTQIYGHKWSSSFGEGDHDNTWAKGLADLTVDELKKGFIACVKSGEAWPPTLPEFRRLCRPAQRKNEAMYRAPAGLQVTHQLSSEQRKVGREHLSGMLSKLRNAGL